MKTPRIAVPQPTSADPGYNQSCWPQYAHAIQSCGGIAVPIPCNESQSSIATTISGCSAILLPGSPADLNPQKYGETQGVDCNPADAGREAVDELLLQDAFNLGKPILGICYGHQALNVWRGGSLLQHIGCGLHDQYELTAVHPVRIRGASHLAYFMGIPQGNEDVTIMTNSSHHQAIKIAGDGMRIAGTSNDGIIEAMELGGDTEFVIGVQWHPERTFGTDKSSQALFQSFVDASAAWKLAPITDSVADSSGCSTRTR